MAQITPSAWTDFLARYPNAHILQTAAWGRLKSEFGWQATHVIVGDSGAQVLFRRLPLGLSLAYIPRGPVGNKWERLWPEVDKICRKQRAIFLKVEPDLWKDDQDRFWKGDVAPGFRASPHEIQPPRTLVVNLDGSDDQILARMKQKTRYNIRLARRKGVVIRQANDIDVFYQLMQVTGERDAFGVHSKDYYQRALELFEPYGKCGLFCAEFDGQPLASLMDFAHGARSWYFYGASSNQHRHLMANYLLQWRAMQWAKSRGCIEYDLWGVPDEDNEALETNFLERRDGLWGVYRFKRGFGGRLKRVVGAWDRVYNPILYKLYLYRMGNWE
jgi:lipid II:glycine glycyltransferase (peptidoglycan interpeptide bridge formation enzyme)